MSTNGHEIPYNSFSLRSLLHSLFTFILSLSTTKFTAQQPTSVAGVTPSSFPPSRWKSVIIQTMHTSNGGLPYRRCIAPFSEQSSTCPDRGLPAEGPWKLLLGWTLQNRSQNHRMLGVGRNLCGSSSPTPLPKQGHLQQAAQDRVQAGPECLQRRRIHNLPGQPFPVLRHPQSEEFLPHVQLELPVPQFVPTAPCPVTGHH